MKKIYVDVPYGNRSQEAIKASQDKLFTIAKDLLSEELEMVTEPIPEHKGEDYKTPILATINKVAECDYYVTVSSPWCCDGLCCCSLEDKCRDARSSFVRAVAPNILRLPEQPIGLICPDVKEKRHMSEQEALNHSEEENKN